MKSALQKAKVLIEEALPYLQKFKGKTIVIKYGGKAMISKDLKESVMKDISFLKTVGINPVVVHGGGPEVNAEMKKSGVEPTFVRGLRVTDKKTVSIIKKVFGSINKEIVSSLKAHGVEAKTINESVSVSQKDPELGFVGEIQSIDTKKIQSCIASAMVPVISPLGIGAEGTYNINADTAATKIAIALSAEKLTLLTDVDGVIENGTCISHLSIATAHKHINKGIITQGMIPKVEACIEAVQAGCGKAHLINGTISHSLLFEIFTDEGIGTEVVANGSH